MRRSREIGTVRDLVRALNRRRLLDLPIKARGCYGSEGDVGRVLVTDSRHLDHPLTWRGRLTRVILDTSIFTG